MRFQSLQSYSTLRDPMDCSLPGSSVHGDSPGKHTGVGCHALLQGIKPTFLMSPALAGGLFTTSKCHLEAPSVHVLLNLTSLVRTHASPICSKKEEESVFQGCSLTLKFTRK